MSSDAIIEVGNENFQQEVINSDCPVLLDLWAPWCAPCNMIAPVLEELAGELGGQVKIAKLNVDEAPELAGQYGVRSIPTLIYFKNGEVADQRVGVVGKEEIKEMMGV